VCVFKVVCVCVCVFMCAGIIKKESRREREDEGRKKMLDEGFLHNKYT